jgi:hypothetical protein
MNRDGDDHHAAQPAHDLGERLLFVGVEQDHGHHGQHVEHDAAQHPPPGPAPQQAPAHDHGPGVDHPQHPHALQADRPAVDVHGDEGQPGLREADQQAEAGDDQGRAPAGAAVALGQVGAAAGRLGGPFMCGAGGRCGQVLRRRPAAHEGQQAAPVGGGHAPRRGGRQQHAQHQRKQQLSGVSLHGATPRGRLRRASIGGTHGRGKQTAHR